MQRFIGLVIFLGAVIGAYFCAVNVLWQDDAVRRFVPVKAALREARIDVHHGSKGSTSYSPEATYSYLYDGQPYTSRRVLPLGTNAGRSWAQDVLNRIERSAPGGNQVTAYVNPRQPGEAILVRDYSFGVYAGGMGTLFVAVVGLGLFLGMVGTWRTKMEAVALDDSGWQLLLPQLQLRKQFSRSVLWLVGTALALTGWPAHWMLIARQGGLAAVISVGIVLAALALFGIVAYRRWSVSHHISDARLRIRPAPVQRGASLALDVGIDARVPLQVTALTAKLVCVEHYKEKQGNKVTYGTRSLATKTIPLAGPAAVPADGEIAGQGEVTLETSLPPTTDLTIKNYPYYTWEIRLKLELVGAVDYAAVFPLEVD